MLANRLLHNGPIGHILKSGFHGRQLQQAMMMNKRLRSDFNNSNHNNKNRPESQRDFDPLNQFQNQLHQPQPFQSPLNNNINNLNIPLNRTSRFSPDPRNALSQTEPRPSKGRTWKRIVGVIFLGGIIYLGTTYYASLILQEEEYVEVRNKMMSQSSTEQNIKDFIEYITTADEPIHAVSRLQYYLVLLSSITLLSKGGDFDTCLKILETFAFFLLEYLFSKSFSKLGIEIQQATIDLSLSVALEFCKIRRSLGMVKPGESEINEQLLLLNIAFAERFAADYHSTLVLGKAVEHDIALLTEFQSFKHNFTKDGESKLEGDWILPPIIDQKDITKNHLKDYELVSDAWPGFVPNLFLAKMELVRTYIYKTHYSLALRELSTCESYLPLASDESIIVEQNLYKLGLLSALNITKEERCSKLRELITKQEEFLKSNASKLQEIKGIDGLHDLLTKSTSSGTSNTEKVSAAQISATLGKVKSGKDTLISVKRAQVNLKTFNKTLKFYDNIESEILSAYKEASEYLDKAIPANTSDYKRYKFFLDLLYCCSQGDSQGFSEKFKRGESLLSEIISDDASFAINFSKLFIFDSANLPNLELDSDSPAEIEIETSISSQ